MAVEVMTDRAPRTAADLVLHSGVNLKDSVNLRMSSKLVDQYCDQLVVSLGELYEECRDAEVKNRRRRVMREADKGPGMSSMWATTSWSEPPRTSPTVSVITRTW